MSERIEYLELRFADVCARLKAMTVPCTPADNLDALARDPVLEKGTSLDGSSVAGLSHVEHSDLRLEPDPTTLVELPFREQRTAAVMCFIKEKTGPRGTSFYPRDSRGVLHVVCGKHLTGDLRLRILIEPEFHLITRDRSPFDHGGYADTHPASPGAEVLLSIAVAARSVGMRPRVIHHEAGRGQQEIEIDYDDVRRTADNLLLFKNLARAVARASGIDVTFMPKPFEGSAGNGLHCHIQLWEGERNLFGREDGDNLSDTARAFVAGLLEHAPAIAAVANSTVNSYKRLVPHHEAPVSVTWGFRNRTVLVRVPLFDDPQKAAIEFRSADSMANPYLLFSALIACGFDGVRRRLTPPEPRSEDLFRLTDEERRRCGIGNLPSTLEEALDRLEADAVLTEAFGKEMVEAFLHVKRKEWRQYANLAVTDWEWAMYGEG